MEDTFVVLHGPGVKDCVNEYLIVEVIKAHLTVEDIGRRVPAGYILLLIQLWRYSSIIDRGDDLGSREVYSLLGEVRCRSNFLVLSLIGRFGPSCAADTRTFVD
jgi:hypothetical protein